MGLFLFAFKVSCCLVNLGTVERCTTAYITAKIPKRFGLKLLTIRAFTHLILPKSNAVVVAVLQKW